MKLLKDNDWQFDSAKLLLHHIYSIATMISIDFAVAVESNSKLSYVLLLLDDFVRGLSVLFIMRS